MLLKLFINAELSCEAHRAGPYICMPRPAASSYDNDNVFIKELICILVLH